MDNKAELEKALRNQAVGEEDITELLRAIDNEVLRSVDSYSNPVKSWIGKMLNKSLDGTWQVGIGAAGAILAEAIAKYYGLK